MPTNFSELLTFHFDKSTDSKLEHFLKTVDILLIFDTSKFSKPITFFNLVQSINKPEIL